MGAIHYEEYRNSHPGELDDDIFDAMLDHDDELMDERARSTPVAEFVLRAVNQRFDWPAEVTEWQQAATHWIPAGVQSWWFEQFDSNPGMDDMSSEWWQTQSLGVIAAWHDDVPVGAVSLTRISAGDRGLLNEPNRPLFNEVRGLVVDPKFRNSQHKIGTQLVKRIVAMGTESQGHDRPLATIAITNNPLAADLFRASGAVSSPADADVPLSVRGARTVACWRQWQSHNWPEANRCDICPTRDNYLWLWSTKPNVTS